MAILEDPDFDGYVPDKSLKGARPEARERPPWVAWLVVYAINLILPLHFGWTVTRGGGRVGMLSCTLLPFALGCRVCFLSRTAILTVVWGGWVVAAFQCVAVLHIVAGAIGLRTALALGLVTGQRADDVGTVLGGAMATVVTGGILLAVAAVFGLAIRGMTSLLDLPTSSPALGRTRNVGGRMQGIWHETAPPRPGTRLRWLDACRMGGDPRQTWTSRRWPERRDSGAGSARPRRRGRPRPAPATGRRTGGGRGRRRSRAPGRRGRPPSRSSRSLSPSPCLDPGGGGQRVGPDRARGGPGGRRRAWTAAIMQVLGRHERQFVGDVAGDHRRVDDQAGHDVEVERQQGVDGQERLGQDHPPDRAVVQGPLEPLGRGGLARGGGQGHARTGRSSTSARPASGSACRPSPTSRSARPRTAPRPRARGPGAGGPSRTGGRSRPTAGEGRDDLRVDLPGVGLARDRVRSRRSRTPRRPCGRAPRPWRGRRRRGRGSSPGCRSSPSRRGTGGRRSAARPRGGRGSARSTRASPACRPSRAGPAGSGCSRGRGGPSSGRRTSPRASIAPTRPSRTEREPLADQDQVGVVGDVAARRAEVDDLPGRRGDVAVGVDVGHDVVAEPLLVGPGGVEVDVVDLRPAARRSGPRSMFRPSSRSASASATQSRRQVENFRCADQSSAIARLA